MIRPSAPEPRPDRSQLTTGIVLVVAIGLLLLLVAVLEGSGAKIAGAVVFVLAAVPLGLAARAQPAGIGRQNVRPELHVLGWFVAAVAVCAAGLVLYSL